jgi:hypothetical protein
MGRIHGRMTQKTRYYIYSPAPHLENDECYFDGKGFTRYVEKARVFVRKGAAEKVLIRLSNDGFPAMIGMVRYKL